MAKNNVVELSGRDTISDPLTDLLRAGAEELISQALQNPALLQSLASAPKPSESGSEGEE